jgi:hypothetical protein
MDMKEITQDNGYPPGVPYEDQLQVYEQKKLEYEYQVKEYDRQEAYKREVYANAERERAIAMESAREMDHMFNTSITSISAGVFGVSFAFIDNIVELSKASFKPVLLVSWCCFAFTLMLMISSFLISFYAQYKSCKDIAKRTEALYRGETVPYVQRGKIVYVTNVVSLISLIGGIICLLTFVLLNV